LDTQLEYKPPEELMHFLAGKSRPVLISVMWNIRRFTKEAITEISNLLGSRLIIHDLRGEMKGMSSTDDICYLKGPVPHEWLFKRISVAVHHGGLGICTNCIRAGIPMITIPFDEGGNDHPFYAYQISKIGVGVRLAIPRTSELFVSKLVAAIKKVLSQNDMKLRAVELSNILNAEDGLQNALKFIFSEVERHNILQRQNQLT